MPACDICNDPPGADAKRYSAARLRSAVDTGYRPRAVVEGYRSVAAVLRIDLGDDHWFAEWVAQVRRDRTDWVLCRSCWTGLEAHFRRGGATPGPSPELRQPPPHRRRRLFGRRR